MKKNIKKQKADLEKIQKAKDDAEKKLLAEQKKTRTAEAKAAVGLPSSDWTIIKLQLRGHLDVRIITASDWPPPALDFKALFIVRGAALDKELKPHQSLINVWLSGFDWHETVCSKGRASWPLPEAAVLRNAMLKYAPEGV